MQYFLPFLFVLSQASSHQFHSKLDVSDLVHYFGTQKAHQVPRYQLISSSHITKISNNTDISAEYLFTVLGVEYHLYLEPNSQLVSPACIVQKVGVNNTNLLEPCYQEKEFCHHHGYIKGSNQSSAAISTCIGFHGIISADDHDLVIQPVKQHHVSLTGISSDPHLVYRRSATRSKCSLSDPITDLEDNVVQSHSRRKRYAGQYLEVKAVVAPEAVSYHGDDTKRFVTTVLNIAAQRFLDSSLGYKLYLTLVEIMILKDDQNDLSIVTDTPTLLSDFCKWQVKHNPADDSNPRHADHVLLITRLDLADRGDDSNVGLSYNGQLCSQQYKCSVNEDTGVQTGLTIAHEIGHSLGMKHDGDGDDCDSNSFIMAANNAGTLKWSRCSAKYLEDFLSSSKSVCLNDTPAGRSTNLYNVQQKPGMYYSYNTQCRLGKGKDSTQCSGEVDCSVIKCRSGQNCYILGQPLIDGTECGNRKWCIEGKCVAMGAGAPGPINGGWSSWSSSWSECSRSCGGGVKTRTRTCSNPEPRYAGRDCSGDTVMAKLCNVQECATSQYNFKEEQCAATNGELYNGHRYNWLPHASSSSEHPCHLLCHWLGGHIEVPRGSMKYHDGTSCASHSHTGRCINGKCEDFGCDGHHKSGLMFDKCGICNGRGNTCREYRGTHNKGSAREYVTFVKIPKGATGIVITNLNQFCHLSVLVRGERIFSNGTLSPSGSYPADHFVVKYRRQGPEKIEIIGPLPVEIEAQVYRQYPTEYIGTDPEITYVYNMPTGGGNSGYKWLSSPGQCSQTCGQGHSFPEVTCVRTSNNQRVDDFHCNLYLKPAEIPEACNGTPCPPGWSFGKWETCSRSCGGGITHRSVQCAVLQHGRYTPIDNSHCSGQRKPETSQSCNGDPCPGVWKSGTWSCCSKTCGKGIKTRNVACYDSEDSPSPSAHGRCFINHKPAAEEICMEKPCYTSLSGSSCSDKEDCSAYGTTVCTDSQYESFARENCQEYCGYCVKDPANFQFPASDDCKDTNGDCTAYGDDVCTKYKSWAKNNCEKTCKLCVNQCLLRTEPHLTTRSGSCRDKINDCDEYGANMCQDYGPWAKLNCQRTCNFCPVAVTTTPAQKGSCQDKISDCKEYGASACHDYSQWAKHNCQNFCNLCPVATTTPVVSSSTCKDKISDCAEYGSGFCKDYAEWSKVNCQNFCNLCPEDVTLGVESDPSCVDKITDCAEYTKSVCTGFKTWAEQNCQNFCGLCGSRRKRSVWPFVSGEPVPVYRVPQKVISSESKDPKDTPIRVPPKVKIVPAKIPSKKVHPTHSDQTSTPKTIKSRTLNGFQKDIPETDNQKRNLKNALKAYALSHNPRPDIDNIGPHHNVNEEKPKKDTESTEGGPQWQLVPEDVQPIPLDPREYEDLDQSEQVQVDPPLDVDDGLDTELSSLSASQREDNR